MKNVKAVWPLHAAIFFSHEPCVALLLRASANVDAKDCTGRTAMEAAQKLQRDAIVALLRADETARCAVACLTHACLDALTRFCLADARGAAGETRRRDRHGGGARSGSRVRRSCLTLPLPFLRQAERSATASISRGEALFFASSFCLFLFAAAVLFAVVNPYAVESLLGAQTQAALMRTRLMRAAVAWHARTVGRAEL